MILFWIIIITMTGGMLAWLSGKWSNTLPRWISIISLIIDIILIISVWINAPDQTDYKWILEFRMEWISQLGISFHLAIDGLSLLMIILTIFLGILSVMTSWKEIQDKVGFFHFNIMWILAGICGVFSSMDLFLFYFFWEVMLVPMYFLIGIWGHENRTYAAYKFFIFTQASGLLMLISILAVYFIHAANTGSYTFDYTELLGTDFGPGSFWIMSGFLIAFIVKLPVVPFHSWLPDAHTEAPTAGSVILAGLLLKTGAYGILRFVIPLFPDASAEVSEFAMLLGAIGILYGAKLAYAQTDFKRLVAYSSVSHMGFVMVGAFSFNELAFQGTVMQMITHGISTGALFILVGSLQERIHTRDLNLMGGLWDKVPRMASIGLLFTMASLGLPGLGNFIAEFLVLSGAYQKDVLLTAIATMGLVAGTIYSLRIMQQVFHGQKRKEWKIQDFNTREMFIMLALVIAIVWLGLFPQPVLNTSRSSVNNIMNRTEVENKMSTIDVETFIKKRNEETVIELK